jgi:hypothetical protein
MCRGVTNIETCGYGIYFGTTISGAILAGAGVGVGLALGWHALAIGLIVSGGAFYIPGFFGGLKIISRAIDLRVGEKVAKYEVSQVYQQNRLNL